MTFVRFTAIFAAIGLLVPLLFRGAWYFLNQSTNLNVHIVVERLMLLLWPTSLMTLPASPDPSFETKLFLFSLVANVIVYSIIGALVWLGLRRHVVFFTVAGLPLIAIWWWLFTR